MNKLLVYLFVFIMSDNTFTQTFHSTCHVTETCNSCNQVQDEVNEIQIDENLAPKCKLPYLKLIPIKKNNHLLYELQKCNQNDECTPIIYTTNPKYYTEPFLKNDIQRKIKQSFKDKRCKTSKREKRLPHCKYYDSYVNGFKIIGHHLKTEAKQVMEGKLVTEHTLSVTYRLISTPDNIWKALRRYLVYELDFDLKPKRRELFGAGVASIFSVKNSQQILEERRKRDILNYCMFRRNTRRVLKRWEDKEYIFSYLNKNNQLCAKKFLGTINSPSMARRMIGEETRLMHSVRTEMTRAGDIIKREYVRSAIEEAHEILEEEN